MKRTAVPAVVTLLAATILHVGGCKQKITQAQCDQLLDHFAELVVKERFPDAGAEAVSAERTRERQEATHADEFKNCRSEVQANEHDCAMKAQSSDALIKCLE
ncbi:MAG TPA: hypothetical protein VM925_31565 [Labilithrix sp.]|nr:hypothetical protein [Labilithrix sp.]